MPSTPRRRRGSKNKLSPAQIQQRENARAALAEKRAAASSVARGKRPAEEEESEEEKSHSGSDRDSDEEAAEDDNLEGGIDLRFAHWMYPFHRIPRQNSEEEYDPLIDRVDDYEKKFADKLAAAVRHFGDIENDGHEITGEEIMEALRQGQPGRAFDTPRRRSVGFVDVDELGSPSKRSPKKTVPQREQCVREDDWVCAGCMRSCISGKGDGVCYRVPGQSSGQARCLLCLTGKHKCERLPSGETREMFLQYRAAVAEYGSVAELDLREELRNRISKEMLPVTLAREDAERRVTEAVEWGDELEQQHQLVMTQVEAELSATRERLRATERKLGLVVARAAAKSRLVFRLAVVLCVLVVAVGWGLGWYFGLNHPVFAFVPRPTVTVGARRGFLSGLL